MALNHAHGTLTIEADDIVNREHGKNPLTRKEWDKEVRVGVGTIAWILVQSRDRLSFDFDLIDGTRKSMLHVADCAPKADLDAFLRDFAAATPSALIQLAHPSYGLPDPVHEQAKQAAKRRQTSTRPRRNDANKLLVLVPRSKSRRTTTIGTSNTTPGR